MTDVDGRLSRSTKRAVAVFGGVALAVLAWPGPASADTTLGGYSGVAQAEAIRIQIFDPTIPIPVDPGKPQVDGGIAYTKAGTDTGPASRATASYLWPGDTIGDGFGALVGNDKAQYAIQVNSRYPETASSPAKNKAQLTEGNGMTTSTDGFHTTATTTGLGVAGPNTDLLSGIGTGLRNLPGLGGGSASSSAPAPSPPSLPLPVGQTLAGLATVKNVTTTSTVDVGSKTVTSTAQAQMSDIALLHGLITIDGIKTTSTTVSDGKKASTYGTIRPAGVTVAGVNLGLDGQGVQLGSGGSAKLPQIPKSATDLLDKIGIAFTYAPSTESVAGATGSLASDALVVSIDTQPLKTALNVGGLVGPLQDLISKIPKLGSQISPLLGLGPKIVFRIGDVFSTATAAPAYTVPVINPGGGSGTGGGLTHTGGGGVPAISTGGGGTPISTGGGVPVPPSNAGTTTAQPTQPTAFGLPGLGTVPKALILGGLVLAVAFGWVFRTFGGFLLGGARNCAFGLSTGVPDLRKG